MPNRLFDRLLALTLPALPTASKFYPPLLVISLILLGLAIGWLPPAVTAALLGGGILLFFLLQTPVLALYLLIPVVPFSSLAALSWTGFKVGLMEFILAVGVMAWLLRLTVRSHSRPPAAGRLVRPPAYLCLPWLLFLGAVTLSWLNTLSLGATLIETIKWVEALLIYLFAVNLLSLRHIQGVVVVILLTGLAQALLGLYQFIFKVGPEGFLLFGGSFLRAFGTFAQPNPYAGYLGLVLPIALTLTGWAVFEKWPQKPAALNRRVFIIAGLSLTGGLLMAALFASQSRGAWLAFAAAAPAALIAGSKRPAFIVAVLATGGIIGGLVGAVDWRFDHPPAAGTGTPLGAVTQRVVDAAAIAAVADITTLEVTDANFAAVERLAHWQAAREMWRDHPWLGVGFGAYAVIYPAYAAGRWVDPLGHAHNYLLNIGAETGLVGIIGYLIFWISAFGVVWGATRRSSGFCRAVAAGGFGVLVHLHVHNLFDNLYVQGMYLHVAVVLAIVSVIYDTPDCRNYTD